MICYFIIIICIFVRLTIISKSNHKSYLMKNYLILLFFTLMLAACQSDYPEPSLPDKLAAVSITDADSGKQITDDVNSTEVGNILKSLFGKESNSRTDNYSVSLLKDKQGVDRIICINYENDGGFALISAQKTYDPILAYSEEGNFDISAYNTRPLCEWLDFTMDCISESETLPADSLQRVKDMWRRYENNGKLLKSLLKKSDSRSIPSDEYYELSQKMMSRINEWNSLGYRVYSLNDWSGTSSIGDKNAVGSYVQSRINPYYMDDYRDLTIIVEKDFDESSGKGKCMKTNWSQRNGYNQSFPKCSFHSSGLFPTGCGPLAVGQVMYYNKYPDTYNWSNMTLTGYGNKTTSDFLYEVAMKCQVVFDEFGTGTNFQLAAAALREYGYSCISTKIGNVTKYQLSEKAPAILFGSVTNNNGGFGHIWLLEGMLFGNHHSELEIWSFDNSNEFVCFHNETYNQGSTELCYINWCLENTDSNGYYLNMTSVPNKESFTSLYIGNVIYDIKPKN